MVKSNIFAALATTFLLAGSVQAQAGEYYAGAQIGDAPTAAQQAYQEEQLRIRYDGSSLHESERRNGGLLLIKLGKHLFYSGRNAVQGESEEWAQTYEEPVETYE
ncbi:MAG: hypothetical protein ABJH63_11225 [Rhizobiaceae bacterium]